MKQGLIGLIGGIATTAAGFLYRDHVNSPEYQKEIQKEMELDSMAVYVFDDGRIQKYVLDDGRGATVSQIREYDLYNMQITLDDHISYISRGWGILLGGPKSDARKLGFLKIDADGNGNWRNFTRNTLTDYDSLQAQYTGLIAQIAKKKKENEEKAEMIEKELSKKAKEKLDQLLRQNE